MSRPATVKRVHFEPIAPAARYIWAAAGVAAIGVPGIGFAVSVAFISVTAAVTAVAVTATLIACWLVVSGRRWRAWGYAEREHDLVIKRGVLIRRVTTVPYGRMQFVELKQGPIDRLISTAAVQLHTAAAATDAHIPLLPVEEAERLRERLTELGEANAAGL